MAEKRNWHSFGSFRADDIGKNAPGMGMVCPAGRHDDWSRLVFFHIQELLEIRRVQHAILYDKIA